MFDDVLLKLISEKLNYDLFEINSIDIKQGDGKTMFNGQYMFINDELVFYFENNKLLFVYRISKDGDTIFRDVRSNKLLYFSETRRHVFYREVSPSGTKYTCNIQINLNKKLNNDNLITFLKIYN